MGKMIPFLHFYPMMYSSRGLPLRVGHSRTSKSKIAPKDKGHPSELGYPTLYDDAKSTKSTREIKPPQTKKKSTQK